MVLRAVPRAATPSRWCRWRPSWWPASASSSSTRCWTPNTTARATSTARRAWPRARRWAGFSTVRPSSCLRPRDSPSRRRSRRGGAFVSGKRLCACRLDYRGGEGLLRQRGQHHGGLGLVVGEHREVVHRLGALAPLDELHAAVEVLDNGGATVHPVAAVQVG